MVDYFTTLALNLLNNLKHTHYTIYENSLSP